MAEVGIRRAIEQLRKGGLVVLHDDQRDQGDLLAAAQSTTAQIVTIMVQRGGGLVSVAVTPERARDLNLQPMPVKREAGRAAGERTPSMVSVEARVGVSTGISSADRARTISALAKESTAADLVSPGHVFPLVAAAGGVLERPGRLEAAVDAVRLAGLDPAATLCDVLDEDGDLATGAELWNLALDLRVPLVRISDLVETRFDELWSTPPAPHSRAVVSTSTDGRQQPVAPWAHPRETSRR